MRRTFFDELGWTMVPVHDFDRIASGRAMEGPALIEAPQTTVVIDPGAVAIRTGAGSIVVEPDVRRDAEVGA
jgi:N-methylhydantoinase A/oxoprolinase/acetone carboxylase beta subunit